MALNLFPLYLGAFFSFHCKQGKTALKVFMRKKNKKKANFLCHGITSVPSRYLHNGNISKCIVFPHTLRNTHCRSPFLTLFLPGFFFLILVHMCKFVSLEYCHCIFCFLIFSTRCQVVLTASFVNCWQISFATHSHCFCTYTIDYDT